MRFTHTIYPPSLPRPFDKAPAPVASWGRRRAMRTTVGLVFVFATYFLYRHASYLSENADLAQELADEDTSDSEPAEVTPDTLYLPFRPQTPIRDRRVKAGLQLPQECLDAHFSQGSLCYVEEVPKMDVLWTWVNGSDILLQNAKARITAQFSSTDPNRPSVSWKQYRQFRDHDELRFSVRSVLTNFQSHAGTFHLLTNDVELPPIENATASPGFRLGQIPQWLNVNERPWRDGEVRLSVKHHAQIFDPYPDTTFNSYAIETQFGHLEDISENFIYLNDDFFFLNRVTPRTFYTSAYGMVLRMQSDLGVSPKQYGNNIKGEWRALALSNELLSQRFGTRQRPYVLHEAKAGSVSLLHEMGLMWSSQFRETATHPFREKASGNADPSMMFMLAHFVVERWRETLLWSFIVAKHGASDDGWTRRSLEGAWKDLGGVETNPVLEVQGGFRETLTGMDAKLSQSGHSAADPTTYEFSSQDGYPYLNFYDGLKNKWPHYQSEVVRERELPTCVIKYDDCFKNAGGREFSRASDLFKHVAFDNTRCGDCMTLALVAASGATGLEAFLPSPDRTVAPFVLAGKIPFLAPTPEEDEGPVPHLPLTDKWQDGKFALRDVLAPWGVADSREKNVREWTLRALERYRFVIGSTPSHFAMLSSPSDATTLAHKFSTKNMAKTNVALLCVNDDVVIDDDKVARLFKNWARERWGKKAAWEV